MDAIMGPKVACDESGKDPWLVGQCTDIVSTVSTAEGSDHQPPGERPQCSLFPLPVVLHVADPVREIWAGCAGWTTAEHTEQLSALNQPEQAEFNRVVTELLYGTCTVRTRATQSVSRRGKA